MILSVIVLCIGNICRSPLAEAYLKQELQQKGSKIRVDSAGLSPLLNYPAHEHSLTIAEQEGFSLEGHKAKHVTHALIQHSDLVLVMTHNQQKEVLQLFPEARGKVFLVHNKPAIDIADPYQKRPQAFKDSWELIQKGIDNWVEMLVSPHV